MKSTNFTRMATRRLALVTLVGGSLSAFVAGSLTGCEQDPMFCLITTGFLVSTYEVKEQEGTCETIEHDGLGTAYHLGEGGDQNRGDPNKGGMSIVPTSARDYFNMIAGFGGEMTVASDFQAAFGPFTSSHPKNGKCEPKSLTDYEYSHPAIEAGVDDPATEDADESHPAYPADTYKVTWKDVKLTVTPEAPGSYLVGEMTVERTCGKVVYSVRAFGPVLGCENDDDCKIVSEIDPDWKAKCDPDLHISWMTAETGTCVLTN